MPCCFRRIFHRSSLYCEVPNSLITLEPLKKEQQSIFLLQGKTMFESQNFLMNKKIPALKNTTHLFFHVQNLILKSHTHAHTAIIHLKTQILFVLILNFCHQIHSSSGRSEGGRGNIASPSLMRILCDCKHKDQILIILVDF